MKMRLIATFIALISVTACSQGGSGTTATTAGTPIQAAASIDGKYTFDGQAFTEMLKNSNDPQLQGIPEDILKKTLDGLKEFQIEIKGTEATATFGEMVVKGTLSKTGEADGETKYLMTPVDEDKKADTVTLIFKGGNLTLDPGKKETDKMHFKKAS